MKERGDILQDHGVRPEGETGRQEIRSEVVSSPEIVPLEARSPDLGPTAPQEPEGGSVPKELTVTNKDVVVPKLWDLPADKTVDPVGLQELIENTMSFGDTDQIDPHV